MNDRELTTWEKICRWFRHWKPIHLCWLYKRMGWRIPKYLIGTVSNYDLTHYVFGTDSGDSDPDAQTFGTEDDPLTDQAKETPFFIRFQIRETNGKAGANSYWQLYYNTTNNPAGASQVTTTGDGVVKIIDDPGSNIANQAPTDTRVMSEYTGETYGSGEYVDNADDTNGKYHLDSSDVPGYIEFMWCIQFESGAGDNTDYYFYPRCGDSAMDSHSVHPKATTVSVPLLSISEYDSISVDESISRSITPLKVNVFDSINVEENVNVSIPIKLDVDVSDSIGVSDVCYAFKVFMEITYSLYDANFGGTGWVHPIDSNTLAITGNNDNSFSTVDITNPDSPSVLDQIVDAVNLDGAEGIAIDSTNDVAYVACIDGGGIAAIDISNTSDITLIDFYSHADLAGAEDIDLKWYDTTLVAIVCGYDSHKVVSVDVTDPDNMFWLDSLTDTYINDPIVVKIVGNTAFVSNRGMAAFVAIDITDKENLSFISKANINPIGVVGFDIDPTNSYAVVSSNSPSTHIMYYVDITDPSDMDEICHIDHPFLFRNYVPKIINDRLVIATRFSPDSIVLIDSNNLNNPFVIDNLYHGTELNGADDVIWIKNRAYVTAYSGSRLTVVSIGYQVVDVSDSIGISEDVSVEITVPPLDIDVSDSIGINDYVSVEITAEAVLNVNVYDSIGIADEIIPRIIQLKIIVYDSPQIAEEVTSKLNLLKIEIFEQIGITEALISRLMQLKADVSDDLQLDEAITSRLIHLKTLLYETLTVEESISATRVEKEILEINVSDNIGLTEEVTVRWKLIFIELSENIGLTEVRQLSLTPLKIYVEDSLESSDEIAFSISPLKSSVFDSLNLIDSGSAHLTPLKISLSELIGLSESTSGILSPLKVDLYDSLNLTEESSILVKPLKLNVSDSLTLTEAIVELLHPLKIEVSDSLTTTEGLTIRITPLKPVVYDNVGIVESIDISLISEGVLYPSVSDSLAIIEAVTVRLTPLKISEHETISITELNLINITTVPLSVSAIDNVILSELISTIRLPDWQLPTDDDTCSWTVPGGSDSCIWSSVSGGDSVTWSKA